jgi:hypothetical protein
VLLPLRGEDRVDPTTTRSGDDSGCTGRELRSDGLTLGRVGGRIVAEVLIGLLQADSRSFLTQQPSWTPTLTAAGRSFRMKDFLTFAGVDPVSRHAVNPDRA